MFWSTLFLAVPALALAAAIWGVLRRKWYGVLPLIPVAAAGWLWRDTWWLDASEFLYACANQSRISETMMLLLADGAAVMCLTGLWAGWSRCWWFWRALVLAAVPASLIPIEANELILICLLVMPVLTGTAWVVRHRQDRLKVADLPTTASPRRQRQFSLADVLLAFIVVGISAAILRSFAVGHILLADWGLLWLAGSIAAAALTAAAPTLVRGTGKKWLLGWGAALTVGFASWWWLTWKSDSLGLAVLLNQDNPSVTFPLYFAQGQLCFLTLVGTATAAYLCLDNSSIQPVTRRIAAVSFGLLALVMLIPLAAVFSRMMPVTTTVVPLPPSKPFETIQRVAAYELSRPTSSRNEFLARLKRLDEQLVEPGHVHYDAATQAREQTSAASDTSIQSLMAEFRLEMWRAIDEKRDSDAVQLARLQWRIGCTHYRGGWLGDSLGGLGMHTSANETVIAEARSLTADQCRQILHEAMDAEKTFPDFATVMEFHDYWRNVCTGWRERLYDAAAWLAGMNNLSFRRMQFTEADFDREKKRPLASLQAVQYVMALELYQREHGEYPDDLSAVKSKYGLPELTDPYSSVAPVYRKIGDGYLLYSVGFDGHDDQGTFLPPNTSTPADATGVDINLLSEREKLANFWRFYAQAVGLKPAPVQPAKGK
jgi:hypothetical protein